MINNFKAYYDERKALKKIVKSDIFNKAKTFLIRNFSFDEYENKIPIIGDGIYSNSNELIDLTLKKGLLPIFKIKKPLHNEIKSKQRKLVKKIYENHKNLFKKRFNIEGHFGNVKNKFNCFVNAVTYEVAKNLVYAKFLAYLLVLFLLFLLFRKIIIYSILILIEKVIFSFFLSNRLKLS